MTCVPCSRKFATWRQFKRHMTEVHQVAERNLARRMAQIPDAVDVLAVQSAAGHWFLFGQGKLL